MRTVWRAPQCPRRTRKTTGEMKYGVPTSFPEARQPMRMSMKRIKDGVLTKVLLYSNSKRPGSSGLDQASSLRPRRNENEEQDKKMEDGVLSSIPEARQLMRTRIRRIEEDGVPPGMLLYPSSERTRSSSIDRAPSPSVTHEVSILAKKRQSSRQSDRCVQCPATVQHPKTVGSVFRHGLKRLSHKR